MTPPDPPRERGPGGLTQLQPALAPVPGSITEGPPERTTARPWALLAAFLLGLALHLPGIGPGRSLWNPDEPRFGEVVREMDARGDWLTPWLNGEPYSNKPPLLFWSALAASRLTGGVDETALRLPVAVAGAALLAVTLALGSRLAGRAVGWLAAVVLATSYRFFWQAGFGQTDMLLALWVGVSTLGYARAAERGRASLADAAMIYGGAALGTLAKGLPGVVLPGLVAFVDVARRGAWRELARYRIPTGVLAYLVLAVPWFAWMGHLHGRGFLDNLIVRQHFQRYVHAFDHAHGPLHYLLIFPVELLPWTLLLPAVAIVLARDRALRRRVALPLGWFAAILVFFTLAGAKRGLYLLPLYPAAAIAVATALEAWLDGRVPGAVAGWFDRPLSWVPPTVALVAAGAPFAVAAISPVDLATAVAAAGVLVPVALVATWMTRRDRAVRLAAVVLVAVAFEAVVRVTVLPGFDHHKTARPFAQHVRERIGPDGEVAAYAYWRGYFNFYLGIDRMPVFEDAAEAIAFLRGGDRRCLVARDKGLDALEAAAGRPLRPDVVDAIGSHTVVLVCDGV